MDSQLFTWESLATISSISLLIYLIVQNTKKLVDRLSICIPTDFYTIIISYIVLLLVNGARGTDMNDWKPYVLCLFNSFLVASLAGHVHHKSVNPPVFFKKPDTGSDTIIQDNINPDSKTDKV